MCDLLAEDAAQVHPLALQGGSEEAVTDAEHLWMQIQILHLKKTRRRRHECVLLGFIFNINVPGSRKLGLTRTDEE